MSRSGREDSHDGRLESASSPLAARDTETDPSLRSGRGAGFDNHQDESPESEIPSRSPELQRPQTLDESELKVLTDIGTFRALAVEDLARHRYSGDAARARQGLRNLSHKGLIQSRTSYPEGAVYVTLTRAGHQLVADSQQRGEATQRLYHGFVKTREARHDAALYRLYHHETERIEHMGGRVQRVVLDFELKQSMNRKLARLASMPKVEQADRRQEIAQEHGLKVVNGKIPLPDLRLEYEGPDQGIAKVDLELVTNHYHHHNLAAKAQAGFAMYAFAEDAARLRPAMQDPEIMQDIFSL